MDENLVFRSEQKTVSLKYIKRFLITLLILSISITLNYYFHDEFMRHSISISMFLQKADFDTISTISSNFIIACTFIYIPINAFVSPTRLNAFRMLVGLSTCVWLHSFLKMIYMDYRPSFLSKSLRSGKHFCEKEYGMPSGHSMFVAFNLFCIANQYKRNYESTHIYIKLAVYACFGLVGWSVLFSRLYFGVHSFNQVIIGVLLGTFVFTSMNTFKDYINEWVIEPIFQKKSRSYFKGQFVLGSIFLFFVSTLLIGFLKSYSSDPTQTEFYHDIVQCTEVKIDFNLGFSTKILKDGLFSTYFISFLIGISMIRPHSEAFYFSYDGNLKNIMLRFCCIVLMNLPFAIFMAIKFKIAIVEIVKMFILAPCFGFLTGRFGLDFIRFAGIPISKGDQMELDMRNSEVVHI